MSERINFEMTANDLAELLSAMRTMPAIMLQCGPTSSVQERANDAWKKLGDKMGFDHMTVKPNGRGDRFFSAIKTKPKVPAKPHLKRDGDAWCAHFPDFINLQESAAGFGDTPKEAIEDLMEEFQP